MRDSLAIATLLGVLLIPLGATAQSPEPVRVRVVGESGLSLHIASTDLEDAQTPLGIDYRLVCSAPCESELAAGAYRFGVARDPHPPTLVDRTLRLNTDTTLQLEYESRHDLRTAGYFVLFFGPSLGVPFIAGAITEWGDGFANASAGALTITGAVLAVGVAVAGLAMIWMNDHWDVRQREAP